MMRKTSILLLTIAAGTVLFPAPAAQAVDFATEVWPIFEARCVKCHGIDKQKGGIRFDTADWAGEIDLLAPGDPAKSLIYELISLPPGHEDIMPNEGDPLAPEQIELIRLWIADGGALGEWTPPPPPEEKPDLLEIIGQGVAPAPEAELAKVEAAGAIAMPLAMNTSLIRVEFQLAGDTVTDEALAMLPPLAEQLTWLNLARTKITDAGLEHVAKLPKLTRLHLENTEITDAGLAHLAKLENLTYLNIYGTKVTDAGLEHLKGLAKLERLYVWQTGVTPDGAAQLQAALPALEPVLGINPEDIAAPATETAAAAETPEAAPAALPKTALALFFNADSCCGTAHAKGEACAHPCCAEAAAKNEVCLKCNAGAEGLLAIVKGYKEGSCCATALAQGKWCDHPCCIEAKNNGLACAQCNA